MEHLLSSNVHKIFKPESSIIKGYIGKIVLSSSSFFVKIFFETKLLQVYFQCVYIVMAKYQIAQSKAVVETDWPMKAQPMHKQKPNFGKIA